MSMIKIPIGIFVTLFVFVAVSCKQREKTQEVASTEAPDLKHVQVTLPKAPGSQAFNTNCVICHSASLVANQPNFPEKTWTAIVTKMQKTFGAPVSDSSAKIIIQYLTAIKGTK